MGLLAAYRRLPQWIRLWVPYVLVAAGMELALGVVGAAAGVQSVESSIFPIRRPGDPTPDITTMELFVHNAEIAVRSALGIVTFGLYTVYVQLLNGFVIGAAFADAAQVLGIGRAALLILPHGVIEIPAFWLAGAVGFRWMHTLWMVTNSNRDRISVPRLFLESMVLMIVVIVALFVAAYIEANVSVLLV